MNENPLVSIVIPVYNTEKFLAQCVLSITKQTYRNLEIILIEDGSTDTSGVLCDQLAADDERICVFHRQNGGVAAARNLGIDKASGKYVLFLDADDWLDMDAIGSLVAYAEDNKVEVVKFNYVREFKDKQLVKKNTFLEERVLRGEECLEVCRQVLGLVGKELAHPENMNYLAPCWGMLFERALLLRANARFTNIWEVGSFEDGLFNVCVFLHVTSFAYVDKAYYHYRKYNANSETSGYRKDYIQKRINLARILKRKIEEENRWNCFCEAYNNRVVHATMEIALNALTSEGSMFAKYEEIRTVLHHPVFMEAYKSFSLRYLGLKWKVYFFCIKHSLTLPTFVITVIIMKLMKRGTP